MLKNKIPFEELSVEEQFKKVFGNYERTVQEQVLYNVLTEFYFADWTRKCDYDKMTSEEVVNAAMAVCEKLEKKYNYSLADEFSGLGCYDEGDRSRDLSNYD